VRAVCGWCQVGAHAGAGLPPKGAETLLTRGETRAHGATGLHRCETGCDGGRVARASFVSVVVADAGTGRHIRFVLGGGSVKGWG
jgi:hypothetical protein